VKRLLEIAIKTPSNRRSPPKKQHCKDVIRPWDVEYRKHLIKITEDLDNANQCRVN
jgi:hypothetical protein